MSYRDAARDGLIGRIFSPQEVKLEQTPDCASLSIST